jgi:hypothetical protein
VKGKFKKMGRVGFTLPYPFSKKEVIYEMELVGFNF